jgi:hypothetical protein
LLLTGPGGRDEILNARRGIVRTAQHVSRRLKPVKGKIVHLHPRRRIPHVSIAERRKREREPMNEPSRRSTRSAARGATFITSSDVAATSAKALRTSPRPADLALFAEGSFSGRLNSLTGEPSVAANDGRVLETWNWLAALSGDGGKTFTFVNPSDAFPESHRGFCCDQLAYYVPKWDLWVWLLQYRPDAHGNVLRLAVARGSAAFDAARLNAATFKLFDLSPTSFGWSEPAEFDFNGISSTNENLFVATNVATANAYEGLVIRIPLAELASGVLNYPDLRYWKTSPPQAPRLAQGAGDTMYFAAHVDTSTLRVWHWADGSDAVPHIDVQHSAYKRVKIYHCPYTGGAASGDWCEASGTMVTRTMTASSRVGWHRTESVSPGTLRRTLRMASDIRS